MRKIRIPHINTETALKILTSLLAILLLWSLYNRFIYADDGWLGEQANSIANCGRVKTKLFSLYYTQFGMGEAAVHVYHKLFIWLGGLLIYLTGHFNPYLLKSISLIAYVILIITVLYDYRDRLPDKKISSLILLFYFLALPNFIRVSFIYRPDIVVTLFGYLSFRCLNRSNDRKAFLMAGLFAGIATLFHLNGLVFMLSGMAYIALSEKNFKSVFLFGLGASVCLLYFADVAYDNAYLIWWERLKIHPGIINNLGIRNTIPFHVTWEKLNKLFFRGVAELAYSIPLILSLCFIFSNKIKALKAEIRYLALLIFALYFFAKSGIFYNIYFHPYAIILIAYAVSAALSKKNYQRHIAIAVLICNFSIASHKICYFIFKKNVDIYQAYETINRNYP